MRLQQYFFTTVWLLIPASLALSDYANHILDDISVLTKAVEKHEGTVDRYNGGLAAAIPLAQETYDMWRLLRIGNSHLNDTKLTAEDSDVIVDTLASTNVITIRLFNAYREKAPVLDSAGVGFVTPILMQALYREADDYMMSLKGHMPSEHAEPMRQITAGHTAAWEAAFARYDPASNPTTLHPYMRFLPAVMSVLGPLV